MIDERTLVSRVLGGDLQAFRELIRQHERLVLHMIGRLVKSQADREELCQDVFLRVYDKLGGFSFQSKLSTWIATIAYRHAINHLKKNKMLFSDIVEDDRLERQFIEMENPETVMAEADTDQYVMQLVEALPPQYKAILILFHVEGLSYPEICEVTGLPEGTVKSYLFRARSLLKEKVKKHQEREELL